MSVLQHEAPTFQEVPQQALRKFLKKAAGLKSEALGGACGGGCGRGANCSTRSEEEEQLVCGAD
jgi:hypothetical protein